MEESFGSLQLASIIRKAGMSCEIMPFCKLGDVDDFDNFMTNAMDTILGSGCRIVSFYTRCDSYHVVLRLAQSLKERDSRIITVCGGPQSDITSEDTIRLCSFIDYVCCGEGETTIVPFFTSLLEGMPDLNTPGLVYRNGDQVVKNPRPAMLEDLDSLPMIDYSLCFEKEDEAKRRVITIDVGRGCPFACTFCSTKTFWGRKYRLKSPERIRDEIQAAHDYFGDVRFEFAHDMFTMNKAKVMRTCQLIKELDFEVSWSCSARLDCVDRELIDAMVDSGMGGIYFGIETGSPRMQKLVHKNLKLDAAVEIIDYILSKGISVTTSFIFGFPQETEEDLSQTMALLAKLLRNPKVRIQTHLCAFMSGTELSETYAAELTPVDYYSDQTGKHAVEECKDLILGYPTLFQHMQEYKTELRTKLRHFALFFKVWKRVQPAFRYIAEKYPEDRLIDMYYDFVEDNKELLDRIYDMPVEWSLEMVKNDRFHLRFLDDPCFDMIKDMYNYVLIAGSENVMQGGSASGMFSVDPFEAQTQRLQDCKRCVAVVQWHDNTYRITKYPYIKQ